MPLRRYEIVLLRSEPQTLTLEELASRTGMHSALVQRFVEFGLIEPVERQGDVVLFAPSVIPRLRAISRLRKCFGMNLAGIAVTLDLIDKLWALKRENETLRSRL